MRTVLAVLAILFPLAAGSAPAEPANVTETRVRFLAEIRAQGLDAEKCSVEYKESSKDGHYIVSKCVELPFECLFLVHSTEVLTRTLGCVENPEYVAPVEQKRI